MGRPNRGPSFAPLRRSRSQARACSSTRSGSSVMNALSARCDSHRASSAPAYRSAVSSPRTMLWTASQALNSVSGEVADGLESRGAMPSATETAAATVPTTKARRDSRSGFDMVAPQALAHAMHGAAAVADHRDIGIVDGQPFRTAGGDQVLAGGGHQNALVPQGNDVGAELHRVGVRDGNGLDAFRVQPVHQFRLD